MIRLVLNIGVFLMKFTTMCPYCEEVRIISWSSKFKSMPSSYILFQKEKKRNSCWYLWLHWNNFLSGFSETNVGPGGRGVKLYTDYQVILINQERPYFFLAEKVRSNCWCFFLSKQPCFMMGAIANKGPNQFISSSEN